MRGLAPVLAVPEELTIERVPELARAVEGALGSDEVRLVLDLGAVRFLCSSGLGEIVKVGKRLAETGGGLALARPRARMRRLLRLVGLDALLPAFPTLEEAQAHLATRFPEEAGRGP